MQEEIWGKSWKNFFSLGIILRILFNKVKEDKMEFNSGFNSALEINKTEINNTKKEFISNITENKGDLPIKIVLWGTGSGSKRITKYFFEHSEMFNILIIAYIDNNPSKWNTMFMNKPVISPSEIKTLDYEYLVIASVKFEEILKQCIKELGLSVKNIVVQGLGLLQKYYTYCQYRKRYYGIESVSVKKRVDKLVIYTANFGNYDDLKDPLFIDKDIKYICFTDNMDFVSDVWEVRYIDIDKKENIALLVSYYKLFPFKLFKDYDVSVWVDSKFQIIGDLRVYIEEYQKDCSMLCFPHFSRDCIFDEAVECLHIGKGDPIMLGGQIYKYFMENYPKHNGLYEGGCLVRWHKDIRMQNIMYDWWKEINKYSCRDQVSLPYICWKNNYRIDISDLDILNNNYLKIFAHNDKSKLIKNDI